MFSISDDQTLIQYVSKLKTINNVSRMSVTAREQFGLLYDKSRELIADLYNHSQEEKHDQALSEYQNKLLHNEKLYDYEIAKRISQFRSDNRKYKKEDINMKDVQELVSKYILKDDIYLFNTGNAVNAWKFYGCTYIPEENTLQIQILHTPAFQNIL